jgi:hypothetical protein
MTSYVRYAPEGRTLDLASLNAADCQLIAGLHGSIHRGDQVLICLEPGGNNGEMHIHRRANSGKCWAVHFAGGSHGSHPVIPESDEHKRQKEYWARSARAIGLHAVIEYPVSRGVLDVAITGGLVPTDIEVQRSEIRATLVKTRTTRYFNAGYLPVWFNDSGPRPLWLREVPALGCNPKQWNEFLPPPRAVNATGLTVIEAVRCVYGAFERCPGKHARPCGQYHPKRGAWPGLTLDDVAGMVPAGQIMPLCALDGRVYLVSNSSFRIYQELTGGLGEWMPGGKTKLKRPPAQNPEQCRNPMHEASAPLPGLQETEQDPNGWQATAPDGAVLTCECGLPISRAGSCPSSGTISANHLAERTRPPTLRLPRSRPSGTCKGDGCNASPQGGAEYCQACRLVRRMNVISKQEGQ